MFNWFNGKKSFLADWDIGDVSGFKLIQNPDSVQYVNPDQSIIIYFSILKVSGSGGLFSIDHFTEPTVTEAAHGWDVKVAKVSKNRVLVCLISVHNQVDIDWTKTFLKNIRFR